MKREEVLELLRQIAAGIDISEHQTIGRPKLHFTDIADIAIKEWMFFSFSIF
jgi:hypothetical protein